jgi:hypothetical protein
MANRDTSKPWFETGDKPTQAQFQQLLDWLRFVDDPIAMNDIAGLTNALLVKVDHAGYDAFYSGELIAANADYLYTLQQYYLLEKIIVIPGADCTIRIGKTLSGDEIVTNTDIDTDGEVFVIDVFAIANRNIYISGIPVGSKLIFLKRLIKTQ